MSFAGKIRIAIAASVLSAPITSAKAKPVGAATERGFTPVVLIDLVPSDNENPVATRVFSFTDDVTDPLVTQLIGMVRSLNSIDSVASVRRVFGFVRDHGEELSSHSSNRWVSHQGDSVEVVIFRPDSRTANVTFEEQARQSRLTADLDSLIENAGSVGNRMDKRKSHGNVSITRRKYRLRDRSAILKITAEMEAEDADGAKDASDPPVITTIVTGPSERVFLSANASFSKIRQVKYNAGEETFEYGHKPTELLVGINYSMQDMFQNDNSSGLRAFVQGIYLGFLVEPSKRPFNQIAGTVGFRHTPPPFESLFSLETVSPYFGMVWARDDVPDPTSSTHVKTRYGRPALIMGIALGLDKALGWLEGTQ